MLRKMSNLLLTGASGFAHRFCTLANNTLLQYKCTNYKNIHKEVGILWNDKDLKINWPKNKFIVSSKDKKKFTLKIL